MTQRFVIGPFVLDTKVGTLLKEGVPVPVGYRAVLLLAAFLQRPGDVLTKSDLMEAGWEGAAVEEANLTVQIAALRKALGKQPTGVEWIATVPRVGYRFTGQVTVGDDAAPAGFGAVPGDAPKRPSIAVLPFHNVSGDANQDYFADGIVDDLITALSRFKTFAVISRSSSFVYKGRAVDMRDVGRELGVRYVLEGSIRRSGNRLRVTAQLVDAATAGHLWAQNYDGALEDVFDMQDRITESVVSIVEPMVKRAEIERTRLKPPTSLDAYDLYLEAMMLVLMTEPGATLRAIELIERSLALDPNFPPAIAIATIAYTSLYDRQMPGSSEETRRKGLEYARIALAVAGNDPQIRVTGGISVIMLGGEYESGLAAIRQATTENPHSVHVLGYAGVGAFWAGEVDEAEGYLLRAIRLNPNDPVIHWSLTRMAHIRLLQGRFEEALDWASRAYSVSPTNAVNQTMLVAANAFLGRRDDAARLADALHKVSPETTFANIRRGYQTMRNQRQVEVVIDGLRLAGMPENDAR